MDRRRLARPRARRQLFPQAMAAGLAARRIQAAARGFLARRRLQRQRRGLMSPSDIRHRYKPRAVPKRARYPIARIGSNMGSIKKGKKPVPRKAGTVACHFDANLYTRQKQTAYIGMYTAGSTDAILRCYAGALLRQVFSKAGFAPSSWEGDFKMSMNAPAGKDFENQQVRYLRVIFSKEYGRPVSGIAKSTEYQSQDIDCNTAVSFEALTTQLMNEIRDHYNDGFLPCKWEALSQPIVHNGGSFEYLQKNIVASNINWGAEMVDFSSTNTIKFQNVTPATGLDDGSTGDRFNVNDVSANPIQGKLYDFKTDIPKLNANFLENIENTTDSYTQIGKFQAKSTSDYWAGVQYLRSGAAMSGSLLKAFAQPPSGPQVFRSLAGQKIVTMPPGGYKSIIRKANVKLNTRRFIRSLFSYEPDTTETTALFSPAMPAKSMFNKAIVLAVEPTLRTAAGDEEEVHLAANQDIRMAISLRKAPTRALPTYNDVIDRVTLT